MINVGSPVELATSVTDSSGAAADAGAMALAIIQPDGTLASGITVNRDGLGAYSVIFTPTMAGLHQLIWTASGSNAGVWTDVFTAEQGSHTLVGVGEAIRHMRAEKTIVKPDDLDKLRGYCLMATSAVEHDLGRILVPRTITETRTERGDFVPWKYPVQSITSLTVDGTLLDPSTYRLNAGILERQFPSGCDYGGGWRAWGVGQVVLVYVAGEQVPPAVARTVTLETVRRIWQRTQQMPHSALDDVDADQITQAAVSGLAQPEYLAYQSLRVGGIA